MCGCFELGLKILRKETSIKHGCGVRKGDNIAPTLFIIVMQLVSEDVLDEMMKNNVELPKLSAAKIGNGILRLYEKDDVATMMYENVNIFAHVDDGDLVFNSRYDLIIGSKIICMAMEKWVLTVHVRHDGKKSKTELMLFTSTKTLKEWRKVPIGINVERDDSESERQYEIYKKKKKFVVNLNEKYGNAPETKRIIVHEKGVSFDFAKSFEFLGSTLTFLLSDSIDVKNIMLKDAK